MRKKKTGLTEKQIRKSNITQMSVVATMVHNIVMKDDYGVCGLYPFLESRMGESRFVPGVLLQPWKFMELFGEDTEFEYLEDKDGDKTLYVEVNGVVFHALIHGMDVIVDGRLA